MTPTRRPAATVGRLLAHGLGLGLLAGGVVLGAQGAAQALQYVFTASDGSAGPLQVNFRYNDGLPLTPNLFAGSGQVTGTFNWVGGTSANTQLTNVDVSFTATAGGNTANASFANGYYNAQADILYFGVTSGSCPTSPFFGGTTTCLALNLQGSGLGNIPGELVGFDSGADLLGDYFNTVNDSVNFINITNRRDLSLVDGALRQIPAPFSALGLLPLAGLKRYRRRVQRLSQAREAATSAAVLG